MSKKQAIGSATNRMDADIIITKGKVTKNRFGPKLLPSHRQQAKLIIEDGVIIKDAR